MNRWQSAGVALAVTACLELPVVPTGPAPQIDAARVAPNPHNAISAIVSVRVRHADSVAVQFRLAAGVLDEVTAGVSASGDSAIVPVLGLFPASDYVLRVIGYGAGGIAVGEALAFTTDTLPADLPRYTAAGVNPSPGYVVFAAGRYGLVIDNIGRVVWYRRFLNTPGLNYQVQPTGRYVVHPPTPDPSDVEPFLEIDALGNVTRTLQCAGGLASRFHDLIVQSDGAYWIMCDETRAMNLTALGGVANAQVTGTVIQHVSAAGDLLFQWSPFDHFAIADLDSASRAGANVNWTHGNALDLDADGNIVVSFRSLSEITKIDTRTGTVLWRMGGARNQFTFDSPAPAFARQHGLRLPAAGQLVLLDNLGSASGSRGERYVYDEGTRVARQVAGYESSPAVIALLGGTTQDLSGGHTLIAYGNGGRVEEYDASGAVVWRITSNPGYIFRAQRIRSLYHPGAGEAR